MRECFASPRCPNGPAGPGAGYPALPCPAIGSSGLTYAGMTATTSARAPRNRGSSRRRPSGARHGPVLERAHVPERLRGSRSRGRDDAGTTARSAVQVETVGAAVAGEQRFERDGIRRRRALGARTYASSRRRNRTARSQQRLGEIAPTKSLLEDACGRVAAGDGERLRREVAPHTVRPGSSHASVTAIAPLPVPTSAAEPASRPIARRWRTAHSTASSVSGRGRARAIDPNMRPKNPARRSLRERSPVRAARRASEPLATSGSAPARGADHLPRRRRRVRTRRPRRGVPSRRPARAEPPRRAVPRRSSRVADDDDPLPTTGFEHRSIASARRRSEALCTLGAAIPPPSSRTSPRS